MVRLVGISFAISALLTAPAFSTPPPVGPVDLRSESQLRLDGPARAAGTGYDVAAAGDFDGDALPDVLLGAPFADQPAGTHGGAYVVFGSLTGTADLASMGPAAVHIQGTRRESPDGAGPGVVVSPAGDLNADHIDDIVVGDTDTSRDGIHGRGTAYVVFGGRERTGVDLENLGLRGFRVDGAGGDHLGWSAVPLGDINEDGRDDLAIGAPFATVRGRSLAGAVYVLFGALDDTAPIDLARPLGDRGYRVDGAAAGDRTGDDLAAGDVNGDGIADLVIGAPGADADGSSSGSVHVVFGHRSRTRDVDLAALGRHGFRMDAPGAGASGGDAVAVLGDTTGDGRAEIAVGAPGAGRVSVVFGRTATSRVALGALGSGGYAISGPGIGAGLAAPGDMNADGLPDLAIAGRTADATVVFGRAAARPTDLGALGADGFVIGGAGAVPPPLAGPGDVLRTGVGSLLVGDAGATALGRERAGAAYVLGGAPPAIPRAAFIAPDAVAPGEPAQFDARVSTDPVGIRRYDWNFGDGSRPLADEGPTPRHVFPGPGTYSVELTVYNRANQNATTRRVVVVGGGAPTAASSLPTPVRAASDAGPGPLDCAATRPVRLLDVTPAGDRQVALRGVARGASPGQQVEIRLVGSGRVVARPVVTEGGLFSDVVAAPRDPARARYQAAFGGDASGSVALVRPVVLERIVQRAGRVTVTGRVRGARGAVRIERRTDCGRPFRVIRAKVRPNRAGRFTATVAAPTADRVAYRARAGGASSLVTETQ
ncbi:MAG: FG-GAP repeat protein [Solirubrobacteraceae bacterium]|nr:FG-GAP repeat protein [Solirubrobacteraceae bacterium]